MNLRLLWVRATKLGVQCLAEKVMGNLAGVWLLVPQLLRLGAWDLVSNFGGVPLRLTRYTDY
jgi:hypothetical protein